MDVMLDLETLDTAMGGAIVQIGAVVFDPRTDVCGERFSCNIHAIDVILKGFSMSVETMKWWSKQPNYEHLMNAPLSLRGALMAFTSFFDKHAGENYCIWSHGAAFDVALLDYAYSKLGLEKPWHYQKVRDTRTLYAVAQNFGWNKPGLEPSHFALQDAVDQARCVQSACLAIFRP